MLDEKHVTHIFKYTDPISTSAHPQKIQTTHNNNTTKSVKTNCKQNIYDPTRVTAPVVFIIIMVGGDHPLFCPCAAIDILLVTIRKRRRTFFIEVWVDHYHKGIKQSINQSIEQRNNETRYIN